MRPDIAMCIIARDELDTIKNYTHLMEEVDCPQCKHLIEDIIFEELRHVGESMENLKRINPEWYSKIEEGKLEVRDIAHDVPEFLRGE